MVAVGDIAAEVLVALDQQPPYALLDVLEQRLRKTLGVESVRLWLADYDESTLLELSLDAGRPAATTLVEQGDAGRAFREQTPVVADTTVHVPVTMRSERLGVLEAVGADASEEGLAALRSVATAVAYSIAAARRYTDLFELVRRRRTLELPAEIQWELLPVLAHSGPDFALAGSVEPAYDIGGDNFDYSIDVEGVTVSLTDAVGHGTAAALMSTLAVSALRNARRHGLGLRQQVRAANVAVHEHFGGEAFATGMFLTIERSSGAALAVNAGHSMLWRLRGDAVGHVDLSPDVPAGVFEDAEFTAHPFVVQEGDRLLIVSDGVLEALDSRGGQFGVPRLREHVLATSGQPPAEVVRRLTRLVVEHAESTLGDDATAVCVDYRR